MGIVNFILAKNVTSLLFTPINKAMSDVITKICKRKIETAIGKEPDKDEWAVRCILDKRIVKGEIQYLVEWEGFDLRISIAS